MACVVFLCCPKFIPNCTGERLKEQLLINNSSTRIALVSRYRPKIAEVTTINPSANIKNTLNEDMDSLTTIIVKATQTTPRNSRSRLNTKYNNNLAKTRSTTARTSNRRRRPTTRKPTTTAAPIIYQSTKPPTQRRVSSKKPKVVTSEEYTASTSRPVSQQASPLSYDVQKVGSNINAQIYPDYVYDDVITVVKSIPKQSKVLLYSSGIIQCFDQGNFPHPISCRKFISCAKMETGDVLGWEYTCPRGLSFDPIGGICNWATEVECRET